VKVVSNIATHSIAVPQPLFHLLYGPPRPFPAGPSPHAQPVHEPRGQDGGEADPQRKQHLVHDVREHEQGVQPFLPTTRDRIPRHLFHLVAPWLGRPRIDQAEQPRLGRRGEGGDVVRAEKVDPREGGGKVDHGYGGVHPDGVPPVRLHERL